ncbi:minichromosome maintenance protein 5, partial [Spiromyces aspiralis]
MAANGWDSGQTFVRSVHSGENIVDNHLNLQQELFDFIQNFRDGNVFIYREQLKQNIALRSYSLNVNLRDLASFDDALSQSLLDKPAEILPL